MPAKPVEVQAGDHVVRVSSPDRVIYEETPWSAEVTKLQVVEYYVAVEDGIMRGLRDRPTALERWPKGVHEGIRLATRSGEDTRTSRPPATTIAAFAAAMAPP